MSWLHRWIHILQWIHRRHFTPLLAETTRCHGCIDEFIFLNEFILNISNRSKLNSPKTTRCYEPWMKRWIHIILEWIHIILEWIHIILEWIHIKHFLIFSDHPDQYIGRINSRRDSQLLNGEYVLSSVSNFYRKSKVFPRDVATKNHKIFAPQDVKKPSLGTVFPVTFQSSSSYVVARWKIYSTFHIYVQVSHERSVKLNSYCTLLRRMLVLYCTDMFRAW